MKEIKFRAWHLKDKKMYFRAFQKWFYVLLCDDDRGERGGNGRPVKKAFYGDCFFLESTGLFDRRNTEIFEGDIVRVRQNEREILDVVGTVPDTFGSRRHPLEALINKHGLSAADKMEIEVAGNEFEAPELLAEVSR